MAELDDYRGMDAEQFKNRNSETKQQQEEVKAESKQPTEQSKDATDEPTVDSKDVSVLANTFNIDYESLPDQYKDGFANVAKSYREAQSKYTSATQKAKKVEELQKTMESFNQFLQQNPDLYQEIKNRQSGNQPKKEMDTPTSKPDLSSVGKSAAVETQQLIRDGYLNQEDLNGLDELAKQRVVARAELAFLRDQELANFREGLKTEKENLTKAERAEQVKQLNTERINEGVDRVVSEWGVDFTNLDNETISAIQNRALRILDPSDPTGQTIDKDAMYDATIKELSNRGKLPEKKEQGQRKTMNSIVDTGVSANRKSGSVAQPNTREQIYKQRVAENRSKIKDDSGIFGT